MVAGMLGKHTLDAGFGQFLNILGHVCFKRGAYFAKVDAKGTSQTCPKCGYQTNRDIAAAQVVLQRGYTSDLPPLQPCYQRPTTEPVDEGAVRFKPVGGNGCFRTPRSVCR